MKKVLVTLVAIATLGLTASAEIVSNQVTNIVMEEPVVAQTSDELPQVVKDALLKDYPECTVQKVSYNEIERTYTIEIIPKGETETVSVVYKDTGEKA